MGRPPKEIVPDGSPGTEFACRLRHLWRATGCTLVQLAERAGYARTTVGDAMSGKGLPTLAVTQAIAGACGADVHRWTQYWRQVRLALDPAVPEGSVEITPPPWNARAERASDGRAERCPAGCTRTDPHGWYTESVTAELRLDTPAPEAFERRVVVATCDALRCIPVQVSVPRRHGDTARAHGLEMSVVRGGRLEAPVHPYESYFERRLVLPAPLAPGDRHTYELALRIPPAQPMAPHFVHVPLARSEHFRLRVRFDRRRIPPAVWRLAGVPTAVIYQRTPGTPPLRPDSRGTVTAEFEALRVGYGYGLCWQEAGIRL